MLKSCINEVTLWQVSNQMLKCWKVYWSFKEWGVDEREEDCSTTYITTSTQDDKHN